MRVMAALILSLLLLASCGIRRPLVAPKDQAAYDAKQKKRLHKIGMEDAESPSDENDERAPDATLPAETMP